MKQKVFNIFIFFILVVVTAVELKQVFSAVSNTQCDCNSLSFDLFYLIKVAGLLILLIIFGYRSFKSND